MEYQTSSGELVQTKLVANFEYVEYGKSVLYSCRSSLIQTLLIIPIPTFPPNKQKNNLSHPTITIKISLLRVQCCKPAQFTAVGQHTSAGMQSN